MKVALDAGHGAAVDDVPVRPVDHLSVGDRAYHAVAAAAEGSVTLLILGLAISIPLVIFGATLLIKLMERFPVIITIGAALIGFVAGEMAWEDQAIADFTAHFAKWFKYLLAVASALFVVALGKWLARRAAIKEAVLEASPNQEK